MDRLREGIGKLRAGDWDGAHQIAQEDATPWGAWLHGMVHMREGDLRNARYWYAQAGRPCPSPDQLEAELDALEARLNDPPGR
jgi:hypothetical protein